MSGRWNLATVFCVVGIAGSFICLAYRLAPPPVSLQFRGYRTNEVVESTGGNCFTNRSVSALFQLTNGSPRTITCSAVFGTTRLRLREKNPDRWGPETFHSAHFGRGFRSLYPTQSIQFATAVNDLSHALRVSVDFTYTIGGNKWLDRLPTFLCPYGGERSVSITIQE
jgi:hypothetical protein